jgi:OPT family oligopeptide transporter
MAIKSLTEEQIQTWTREQKDRWWLENVFRGDMAQLTIRSAVTGFILGGLLSATNLYIGAKTGWTLGVGLTSVILAFAIFKVMSPMLSRQFSILENNAMQSIATAAGYMTGPLISGLAAYMMVKNAILPWHQMMLFNVVLSILGVLVAFPMKRRFINDEQAPFPEGQACGVVLDTLYSSSASVGMFKALALGGAGLFAGGLKFITGEGYQTLIQAKLLGLEKVRWMSEHLDGWYYKMLASEASQRGVAESTLVPRLNGVDIRQLGLSPTLDLAMFGAGGLMNIRYATNMVVGMIVAWVFAAPWVVGEGWVLKKGLVLDAAAGFSRTDVLNAWILWPGVAMLVCASMAAFLAKPQVIVSAFKGVFAKKGEQRDALGHIEVPLWVSWVGVPVVGAVGVWMAHDWFGVNWWLGALSIPLIIVLTLIAANATAATSITPTGSLSKITQFTFGVLDPKHPQTNLMTALMTTEVASNAANLLMDIKPGYMLGAKPRQQAIGHVIGIIAGAIASTPLFFLLFLAGHKDNPFTPADPALAGKSVEQVLLSKPDEFSFISAVQWKGISEFIQGLTGDQGLSAIIHPSALKAMAFAAVAGVVFELVRVFSKGKSPIAPVAFGLGIVLPPDSTFWMFLGSLFFWGIAKLYGAKKGDTHKEADPGESFGKRLWVRTQEPICAGLIAGAALVGIGDILINTFVLK